MGNLTTEQVFLIAEEVDRQGITFNPLKAELLDHLICDVEACMVEGDDFDAAWEKVYGQISKDHLANIQNETMILLKKQINPVKILGIISVMALAFGALFKILHLPGAGMLLFIFLLCASITLLAGSLRSIYIYRELKGRGVIIGATLLIISFITGLIFKVLHLPGAGYLLLISVIGTCLLFPLISIYFYQSRKKLKDFLIIHLIESNQKGLEYLALTLLGFGMVYNLLSSPLDSPQNIGGVVFFIFSVSLIGLYTYTLTWMHYAEHETRSTSDLMLLIFSSAALIMFLLPVIVPTNQYPLLRNILAYSPGVLFSLIVGVHYLGYSASKYKNVLGAMSLLLIGYPFLRLGIKMDWFGVGLSGLTVDPAFVYSFAGILAILLLVFWKERYFKTLLLLTLASHMIPTL